MTNSERKIKRKVQLIVGASMALFFCLVLVLAVQLAVMANQRSMERNLNAAKTNLEWQIANEEANELYYQSERFIDEYILRELGYGRKSN